MNTKHEIKALTAICLSSLFMFGCVDNNYDINEDIDMTMGLGTSGLALKIGSSEKTYLKDILKVSDSDMLHTMSTGTPMYYLMKDGSANTNFRISEFPQFTIKDYSFSTNSFTLSGIPAGTINKDTRIDGCSIKGSTSMSFPINNIPGEVKSVKKISFSNVNITINFNVLRNNSSKWEKFVISGSSLKFTFPEYFHLKTSELQKNVYAYSGTEQHITIPVDYIELNGDFGQLVDNGTLNIASEPVSIDGSVDVTLQNGCRLNTGDQANIGIGISISPISATSVSGQVNPTINPDIDPIDISSDLPDFLQDEAVELSISNPTILFDIKGKELPIDINFSADVTGNNTVTLPKTEISKNEDQKIYFYQGTAPFDPEGEDASATKVNVPTLSSIINKIPSQITINAKDGRISSDMTKLHIINLPLTCDLAMNYKVLVPFKFDKDLCIVYTDSVCDMAKDLKDYDAEGVEITTDAVNSIPLDLNVEITAYDASGLLIPSSELDIQDATINAAPLSGGTSSTNLSVSMTPKKSGVIHRIDKFKFKITASSQIKGEGKLSSDQYLQMNDLRLRLKGQVIGNFNKKED